MTAGEARRVGHDDVQVIIVTPERGPLSLFGQEAATAVSEELRWAGVELRTGVMARAVPGGLLLEPGGERLDVQRVFSVPRVLGPGIEGVPTDEQGFIRAGDDARVEGCERTWAAGDGVVSPVKFGGLATHQARRAASAIARLTGAEDAPDPGEAVLHGRLLVAIAADASAGAAMLRARRCGGRRARWPVSTCPAGWPSTASLRPLVTLRPKGGSPFIGR
jgi:sulfide:quinone oxidoreductase